MTAWNPCIVAYGCRNLFNIGDALALLANNAVDL